MLGPLIKVKPNKGIYTRCRVGVMCNLGNSRFAAYIFPSISPLTEKRVYDSLC